MGERAIARARPTLPTEFAFPLPDRKNRDPMKLGGLGTRLAEEQQGGKERRTLLAVWGGHDLCPDQSNEDFEIAESIHGFSATTRRRGTCSSSSSARTWSRVIDKKASSLVSSPCSR